LLAWCLSGPALAAPEQAVTVYPADFFAESHPSTASDMVARIPGFILDTGSSARGFAGTAGNVLIDGSRPTAKTDDLNSILQRIPAANVDHIEVIRGGAPGIDMQGQSVIANIVRRQQTAAQAILTLQNTLIEDGEWVPGGQVEYHDRLADVSYEASLTRLTNQWDDSPGNGYRSLTTIGSAPQYDAAKSHGIMQLGWAGHGGVTTPLLGGEWNNNLTLQTTGVSTGIAYAGYGGSRFDTIMRKRNGEFGSHWQVLTGKLNLEALILQRLEHDANSNTSAASGSNAAFLASNDSGESIGRVTARYGVMPDMNIEAGGEMAYNFLDGHSSFVSGGAAVALPNANVSVNEVRGEAFTNLSWKISPLLSLESGARLEYSNIAESGDTNLSRSFFYAKPRFLLTWGPDASSQLRLRVEKVVGQLDFNNFVASSDLASFGVAAGNANLRPEQRWQFEAATERRFLGRGDLVLSLLHEEIKDLQDYVPVGGGLDAPGNVAHATSDKISFSGDIPLDWLGIRNGLLKPDVYWQLSSLVDPVTGMTRSISGQNDRRFSFTFSQDLNDWKSTWGFGFLPASFGNSNWRIDQISHAGIHTPYSWAYWTYNPLPDWSLKVEVDNAPPYRFELRQDNYAGPRNLAPLMTVQDVFLRTRPRLFVQLRKTF
jgi:hypothetical protein